MRSLVGVDRAGGPDALFEGKENVIESIFDTPESVHSGLVRKAG
ncbi:MAG: hypothetical protein U5R49_21505 [Deltaproteobacteria bacterium]|nr:hypothetical protein [Deltaproteobacteria bacterium]